ncbi:cytochrome P450 [Mycobacterium montefiorense]|uniref:Cytochrome P450 hydroxylase n=1 Tax=Mycobacterium montefiorense TaxID=154654 RepID=A0AA37PPY4_9MYCO|nr:cytochrome P450 [Mycobacterium montefiorense]GBG40679.1 cytochrome P450 hydroxylase [Mycobacterium montefiorense]GKU33340.1 cytochrome P450 hydroxylase [Mycobacterium montefiorense]GKU41732.1 cytochrome P450 hydroxylase [Mycobacterium montefiorense]GKU44862.1 cytochrome P450 hydroxylase [Mycobacterium montefiorense]GKU52156.1 cytochrome P450 hydroxylase [Mycobacterium montefiorense]
MAVGTAPASVFDADLPALDYDAGETPAEIYPRIEAVQRQAPIAIGPYGPEVLSYPLVRTVLRDTRFQIPPGINLLVHGITSGPLWDKVVNSLLCLEGDAHHRLRSLTSKAFTPKATLRLHDTMADLMNELVDGVADAGCCDVVTAIARPYPVPIICALLGAPREDWQQFSVWADEIFKAFSFSADIRELEPGVMRAWGELDDYVDGMVARRRHSLTDDLLSDLIRAEEDGDRLNAAELRMLAGGLLLAGTDTTRNQVGASVQVLCEHPEQWELLTDHPELAMRAVEETMRHSPIACGTLRLVVEDAELDGYLFPAGTMVLVNTAAANRDPDVYADPHRVDITREGVPPILTFGGGIHYCLGANLARRELAEALTVLSQRLVNPRIAGPVPWKPMVSLSGPTSLPIEFDVD